MVVRRVAKLRWIEVKLVMRYHEVNKAEVSQNAVLCGPWISNFVEFRPLP